MNFHATDPELGPALVSIKVILMIMMIMMIMILIMMILMVSFKDVETEAGVTMTHVTLRLSIGTFQVIIMMIMVMKIDNQFSIIMKI